MDSRLLSCTPGNGCLNPSALVVGDVGFLALGKRMPTVRITKGNVQTFVRRGALPAGIASQVRQGATVSINYQGNLTSSFRPQSITIDGQTRAFGKGFEPERTTERVSKRRAALPAVRKAPTPRVIEGARGFPKIPQTQTGLSGGLKEVAQTPRGLPPRETGLTAADIFSVARQKQTDVSSIIGEQAGAGFAVKEERIAERERERAVQKALELPPAKFFELAFIKGPTQAIGGEIQKAIKGAFKLVSTANIGQFVKRNGKLQFKKPTEKEFISGRSSFIQSDKQAKKLFKDIKVNNKLLDPDIQSTAVIGGLALGGVTLPSIAVKLIGGGISVLSTIEAIKTAKRGDVAAAGGATTIALLGATEIPALARRGALEFLTRTKLVKEVRPETIFDPAVLKGKTDLPRTTSAEAALKEFKKVEGQVSTATAETANLVAEGVKAGKTKRVLQEATIGLFVTPRGKGSPFFLRIPKGEIAKVEFKIAPDILKPKSIQIETLGVERIPKEILLKGKETALKFQLEKGASQAGKAFITPRSEARFDPALKKALDIKTTPELEAVIPAGTGIKALEKTRLGKLLGFEKVTRVKGEIVTIPERAVAGKVDIGKVLTKERIKSIEKAERDLARVRRAQTKEVTLSRILAPTRRIPVVSRSQRISTSTRGFRTQKRPVSTPRRSTIPERSGRATIRETPVPRTPKIPRTTQRILGIRETTRSAPARAVLRSVRVPFRTAPSPKPRAIPKIDLKLEIKEDKKDKRLARIFKFQPSIEAKALNIKGVSPKILTGIPTRKLRL